MKNRPVDPQTDSTLDVLERAQAGDQSAARILFERAVPPVRRWAHGRLPRYARGDADTEDVVQGVAVADLRDWKPSPLEAAIVRQELDRFLEALRVLRPADRQVVVWRIELGYTTDEIAAKLGKSKAAAGMTVSRAMARLAKALNLTVDPAS
jgi:DNA-directed RNA polymerase specialized sigma24 family protein